MQEGSFFIKLDTLEERGTKSCQSASGAKGLKGPTKGGNFKNSLTLHLSEEKFTNFDQVDHLSPLIQTEPMN